MYLGRVEGIVWASIKDERLDGIRLCIVQPVDERLRPWGEAQVAVDVLGLSDGALIFWVDSTEAGFVHEERGLPSEISIVGLVDSVDLVAVDPESSEGSGDAEMGRAVTRTAAGPPVSGRRNR